MSSSSSCLLCLRRPSSSPCFSPRYARHYRPRSRPLQFRAGAGSVGGDGGGVALVWLKRDLRVDDHQGFVDAVKKSRVVVPVYVFDHRILEGYSDEMLQLLIFALQDLKDLLKDQGSDLLIGFGSAEDVILKLVNEVKATHIFVEDEVEYNIRGVIDVVESSVSSVSFAWGGPEFVLWRTPFYDTENLKELPAFYNGFQKLRLPLTNPVSAPSMPVLNVEVSRGSLPTFDDLKKYLKKKTSEEDEKWIFLKRLSARLALRKDRVSQVAQKTDLINGVENFEGESSEDSSTYYNSRWKLDKSVFASEKGQQVRGGTDTALNALAAYLRYLEGTARDDWQELHDKLRLSESRRGASFVILFGSALYLGILSRRRVHYEAIKYERERNGGFLSPFGYSAASVAATVETVCSMEWYWLMASKSQNYNEALLPIRIWRWKGYLIQYTVVGDVGPPILFVHGFGAFLEHFRDNISTMADSGHRVWGITLLGFGRSEKPNLVYTQLIWAELLRDFIIDVVREPVHLVGNSIGGYTVAAVAGLWPVLAKSVVLLNSAGPLVPNYSSVQAVKSAQTSENGFAWLGSRLLLLYLRLRAGDILKNCYPCKTERVDGWLINEILRASYDPGVLVVLESVFNFNMPVPLNYLLESFGGKVLVIQGMRDPLSDSKLRVSKFKEHCSWVTVKELDAGHCPHDELPAEVNSILREWVFTAETDSRQRTSDEGSILQFHAESV